MSQTSNDLNISSAGYVVFDGTSSFSGRTFQAGTGITLTNASGIAGNTTIATTASLTDLHTAKFIVSSEGTSGTGANFTTITAAIAAAQGTGLKSNIFIMPGLTGTYTENFTLPANINLTAFQSDSTTPTVTIIGKITCNDTGSRSITGIRLQTNSNNVLSVTGANATVVYLYNCFINATNNTAISITAGSSSVSLIDCIGNLATTGIAYFSISAGGLTVFSGNYSNTGNSTTANAFSGTSVVGFSYLQFTSPITTSNTSIFTCLYCQFTGVLTFSSTNTHTIEFSEVATGSSSAISISAGSSATVANCIIITSNTNAITGSGTLLFSNITFENSSVINTSTQTPSYTNLGKYKASGQPCFQAYSSGNISNVTGDATNYTIIFDSTSFDQNSNFNTTTGIFTAPVTGKYLLCGTIGIFNVGAAHTQINCLLVTTAITYNILFGNPFAMGTPGTGYLFQGYSIIANMTAADTAKIQVQVTGGTKTIGIYGAAGACTFSGQLLC